MLIVAEWLQEYLTDSLSLPQMADALEVAGVEVEDIHHPPKLDEKIVVGEVSKIKEHPGADRLKVAEVWDGNQTQTIVCGAPNVAEGQHVALAHVGAALPDGTAIKSAEIRGEKSAGMLCSERELGLGNDHDGILVLGDEVTAGTPLSEIYNEKYSVIDVKTAANRPDLQSYHGLAVEVAAHTKSQVVPVEAQKLNVKEGKSDALFSSQLTEQVKSYALVRLKVDAGRQAPGWMQRRLRLSGVKTINAVVDITNYCMLETGQPLHAFDAAKVNGRIEVRFAKEDEVLTTLDGVKRTLSTQDMVIADEKQAIALAGVMGGESSEITDKTVEILLEAATFDSTLVRKSAKRHGLRTEASARFERGLPVQSVKQALKRACQLLVEHADARVLSYKHQLDVWPWVQQIGVRNSFLKTMSGLELTREQVADNLRKLNFDADAFDIVGEARKHLGKPYKWGASFRNDGEDAFDCSYLIDRLYSLIGVRVGHTALGQYELGRPVEAEDLRPGDVVFIEGKIDKSATDHYFTSGDNGKKEKVQLQNETRVGHNGLYIGGGKVVMAAEYRLDGDDWVKRDDAGVIEVELAEFTDSPGYLGAKRYADDLSDYIRVTVPWWRPDVKIEADVMEEVVKLVGFDSIPAALPAWRPEQPRPDSFWHRWQDVRWLMKGQGLYEVNTYPFISADDIDSFKQGRNHLRLQNPRSREQAYLRTSLFPQLMKTAGNNVALKKSFSLFEIARVFLPQSGEELPSEPERIAALTTGESALLHVKGLLDRIFELAHIKVEFEAIGTMDWLHPARQAAVKLEGQTIGYYGQAHPDVQRLMKLSDTAFFEVDMSALISNWSPPEYKPPGKYQSGYRDLTVYLPHHVSWQDISATANSVEGVVSSFGDEYMREQDKALTIHLELIAREQTLTDKVIESRLRQVADALKQKHGAKEE